MKSNLVGSLLLICSFTVGAEMSKSVWWISSADQYTARQSNTPCEVYSSLAQYRSFYKMVGLLTLSFDKSDGMLSNQMDFINQVAQKIGDSYGFVALIPAGAIEYTMQYGHPTGILANVKYECYVRRVRETRPILYDTLPVYKTVYDTVFDTSFVVHDTTVVTKYDTTHVHVVHDTTTIMYESMGRKHPAWYKGGRSERNKIDPHGTIVDWFMGKN